MHQLEALVPIFEREKLVTFAQLNQLTPQLLHTIGVPMGLALDFMAAIAPIKTTENDIQLIADRVYELVMTKIEKGKPPKRDNKKPQFKITKVLHFPESNLLIDSSESVAPSADAPKKLKTPPAPKEELPVVEKVPPVVEVQKPVSLDDMPIRPAQDKNQGAKRKNYKQSKLRMVYSVNQEPHKFPAPKTVNPFAKLEKKPRSRQ